jgi:hypothetical protein
LNDYNSKPVIMKKIKGKIVPVQAMKAYGGADVQLQFFLTLFLDGGERSVACYDRLTLRKRSSGIGG